MEIPYGLRGETLLHVSEVERGAACGCVCPACGGNLVARKGEINIHHFAHADGRECRRAAETTLHRLAKASLLQAGYILLPAPYASVEASVIYDRSGSGFTVKRRFPLTAGDGPGGVRYDVENATLEKRLGDIIPDLIVTIKGVPLLVEVVVAHGIDVEKRRVIQRMGLSALIVDLRHYSRFPTRAELDFEVVDSIAHKAWFYNAKAEQLIRQMLAFVGRLPVAVSPKGYGWVACPLYRKNRWLRNCFQCEFFLDAATRQEGKITPFIHCGHARRVKTYADFLQAQNGEAAAPVSSG